MSRSIALTLTAMLITAGCGCASNIPAPAGRVTAPAAGQHAAVPGIEELHRLDLLPAYRESVEVASVSSYDRTGGNDDGFSGKYSAVRRDGDAWVIADLKGPGVIYRIWTPTPTDDPMEFYFDGEPEPRIRVGFRELFLGQRPPFVAPLAGYGGGGYYSYVPLPYRQSCRVVIRAKQVQFYQINYATYPETAPIVTFDPNPSPAHLAHQKKAEAVFAAKGDDLSATTVPPGTAVERHAFDAALKPGGSVTLFDARRGGRIAGLRIGPAEALAGKDRAVLLRITFDGEPEPAVFCPAGDFFGYAWGSLATGACLLGTADGTNYCYLPMPFDRSARVELVSRREAGPPVQVKGEIAFAPLPRRPWEGKLYAVWRRENPTTKGEPFTFVDAPGRGHVVGCVLQAQGGESGHTYFFEGDDQTTLDGKLTIHGTGSEDFFNGGWYDVPDRWDAPVALPLSGCLLYQRHLGRTGGYRFMIGDVYPFREGIRHVIEHAPTGNDLVTDYCATTFLYSDRPPFTKQPTYDARTLGVVDFNKIIFAAWWSLPVRAFCFQNGTLTKKGVKLGDKDVRYLSLAATGDDFFGPPFVSITVDVPTSGDYAVSIEAIKGPAQGQVRLFRNENPVGDPADLYAEQQAKSDPIGLGVVPLTQGPNHLMFKLVGKNAASTGLGFDVVNIICERVRPSGNKAR